MKELEEYNKNLDGLYILRDKLAGYRDKKFGPENEYLHPFYDRSLNNALNQIDLNIGLKHLIVSHKTGKKEEANYFTRAVAHTAYEILVNSGNLLGSEVPKFVAKHLPDSEKFAAAKRILKEINLLRKDHEAYLEQIRHNLFGHKHPTAIIQMHLSNELDIVKVYEICYKLSTISHQYLGATLYLTQEIEPTLTSKKNNDL